MTLNRIITFINNSYKVNIKNKAIRGKKTYLQYFYYILAKTYTKASHDEIGEKVKKNRATVISGIKAHNNRCDVDKKYLTEFINLQNSFDKKIKDEQIIALTEAHKIYVNLTKDFPNEILEEINYQLGKIIKNTIN
jgi:hypothetical protein